LVILRGEIYWVDCGETVGAEIRKTRPAVVVSNDRHNANMAMVTVVPLSSGKRAPRYDEVAVPAGLIGDGRRAKLKTHQIRAVDKSRLGRKFGELPAVLRPALDASLRIHLGL
jgi:mRNA interferase MazF